MLRQSQKLRNISTVIFILFILSLGGALIISHLFRAPPLTGKDIERYAILFTDEDLQDLGNIMLKNQLGSFQLEKKEGRWALKYPKQTQVEGSFVEGFIETLKSIKIKKTFRPDPINMTNFSLNTPLVEIVLIKENGERKIIRMGLINPVDNSTYLNVSDQNIIYHIDALKTSLNALNLSDFTEAKIFSFNKDDLSAFKIFKGEKNENQIQLAFSRSAEGWGGREGTLLNNSKVAGYLEKLLTLKSLPLSSPSQEVLKKIEETQGAPLFTLELEGADHKIVTYKVLPLQNNFPELEITEKELAVIRASNKEFPNIVTRESLNFLEKTEKDF